MLSRSTSSLEICPTPGHKPQHPASSPRERPPPVSRDHRRRLRESRFWAVQRRGGCARGAQTLVELLQQASHQATLCVRRLAPLLAAVIRAQLNSGLVQVPVAHQQHCHVAPLYGVLIPELRAQGRRQTKFGGGCCCWAEQSNLSGKHLVQ